jgi:uncharacterized protein DUF3467
MSTKVVGRQEYSKEYRAIPTSAFFSTVTDNGIELTTYTEEQDFTPNEPAQPGAVYVLRTIQARIIINPVQAKMLSSLLKSQLDVYEKTHGKILTPQEIEKAFAELAAKHPQAQSGSTLSRKPDVGVQ